MDKKFLFPILLAVEAAVCTAAAFLLPASENVLGTAVTFPFRQLGGGLRTLSLSGTGGNLAAWIFYVLLGILPLLFLVWEFLHRKVHLEDSLAVLLSLIIFISVYLFINPRYFEKFLPVQGMSEGAAMMWGSAFYSVLLGYVILKMLRKIAGMQVSGRLTGLQYILGTVCAVLVFYVFFLFLTENMVKAVDMAEENSGASMGQLQVTGIFLWLGYAMKSLPYIFDILVMLLGICLLGELKKDRFSKDTVTAALKLEKICRCAVLVNILSCILMNLAQLFVSRELLKAEYSIQIPLISVALMLAVMVMAKYFADDHALKEENDLFI